MPKIIIFDLSRASLLQVAKSFLKRTTLLLVLYLAFAAVELYLHWYAGTQSTPRAHWLREWYLYRDPQNGKTYHGGSADLYTPAMLLGLIAGIISTRRSRVELAFWVLFLSAGIVILNPVYVTFFPKGEIEWPASTIVKIAGLTFRFITVLIPCTMIAFVARAWLRRFKHLD